MDRRVFLTRSAGLTAGAAALSTPALSQGRQEVTMVTMWPSGFVGLGTGAQRIADRITLTTGGRLTVRLHAAGELVPALEVFDTVSRGDAQLYHGADHHFQDKHPGLNFFTGVPLGLTAKEMNAWIAYGGGQALWDELSGQFGIKPMMAGNSGVQMGGWFKAPVTSLEGFQGLRMRMPGLGAKILEQLGGTPVALPDDQVIAAIEGGLIDAAEWIGPYADRELGLQNYLKAYMYPGFQEPGMVATLGANRVWWNSLDDNDRLLISACAEAENDMMLAEFNANNGSSLRDLRFDDDVVIEQYPEDVWAEIAQIGEQVVNEAARSDLLGAKILSSYKTFRRAVSMWSEISDQAFLRARADALGHG